MLLLIAMAYAGVYAGAGFGVDASTEAAPDRAATFAAVLFLDNRAFPLFALLFGYGLAWSVTRRTAGTEPNRVRRTVRRRAFLLLLFGVVHAFLVFPGEILASYGLALLATGWLLFRSDRALNIAAVITGVFYLLTVPLIMLAATTTPGGFAQSMPGYTAVEDWIGRLVGLPISPVYVAIAYPLLLLVILGYRAGRARLFDNAESQRAFLRAIAWGGVSISLIGALPAGLILIGAIQAGPFVTGLTMGIQVLTGVAGGAGYAACFALGAQRIERIVPTATRVLAAIGKRSLTFYIFNSVMVTVVLHPELIGVGAHVGHFGALVVAGLSWMVSLFLAAWLERKARIGPLEAVMRRGIHGTGRSANT